MVGRCASIGDAYGQGDDQIRAAPGCAMLVVFIGGSLGGWAGKEANDLYHEELPIFMHWLND